MPRNTEDLASTPEQTEEFVAENVSSLFCKVYEQLSGACTF